MEQQQQQQKPRGRLISEGPVPANPKDQSGNPQGRACGSRNRAQAMQLLLDGEAEALTRKAVQLAPDGDTTAPRLCLDRLMPPTRERLAPITVPQRHNAGDLKAAMAAIMAAIAVGEISAREGVGLARLIDVFLKALEIHDLERRSEALEQAKAAAESATYSWLGNAMLYK
jgi:hypothetical protein